MLSFASAVKNKANVRQEKLGKEDVHEQFMSGNL